MTWWVEPAGDGTVVRYGTGNLGVNGVLWEHEFTVGDWHQLGMHVRAQAPPFRVFQRSRPKLLSAGAVVRGRGGRPH